MAFAGVAGQASRRAAVLGQGPAPTLGSRASSGVDRQTPSRSGCREMLGPRRMMLGSRTGSSGAHQQGDVDGMWQLLEATLVQCHGFRSEGYKRPAATTKVRSEEPRRNLFTGEALSEELVQAALRKRRVQQWVCVLGRTECESQLRQLKAAIAEDSNPMWQPLPPPTRQRPSWIRSCKRAAPSRTRSGSGAGAPAELAGSSGSSPRRAAA
jgi:hypothetical protein